MMNDAAEELRVLVRYTFGSQNELREQDVAPKEKKVKLKLESVVSEQLEVTMQREDVVELEGSLRRAFRRRASNAEVVKMRCVPDTEEVELHCVPSTEGMETCCVPDADVMEMRCTVEDVKEAARLINVATQRVGDEGDGEG